MRKKLIWISLVLSSLILGACQATLRDRKTDPRRNANSTPTTSSSAPPSSADPKVVEELKELLAKYNKALSDKNLNGVMGTFSTDANTVTLGTGHGERWAGQEAIKQAYTEIFEEYDGGTLETNCDWKTSGADQSGTMAWLAAACLAKGSMKGVKREYVLNISATVVKQDIGWRFVMLHMSSAGDDDDD
jgi:uncharacterized protein (TIGR02246 family)